MSVIPVMDTCIVCDMIRPELGGKVMILGFMGLSPHVDIGVPRLEQPIMLTFVLSGSPCDGTFMAAFDIVETSNGRVVAATAPFPCVGQPDRRTSIAPTLLATFGHPGGYAMRFLVEGKEQYRALFAVSQGVLT